MGACHFFSICISSCFIFGVVICATDHLTAKDFEAAAKLPLVPEGMTIQDIWRLLQDGESRAPKHMKQEDRAYVATLAKHWPNNIVPYTLGAGLTDAEKATIAGAITKIESTTCVRWIQRTTETNYVEIDKTQSGCYATLGYVHTLGKHTLNLEAPGCMVSLHAAI